MINTQSVDFKELPLKIIWATGILTLFGLIVLKSISQHNSGTFLHNPFFKQIIFLIPALIGAVGVLYIPRYSIHKYAYAIYFLGIILVLLPFSGNPHAGTYRWLNIGFSLSIQPSEFAKVFIIISLARYLSDHNLQMRHNYQ